MVVGGGDLGEEGSEEFEEVGGGVCVDIYGR